MNIIGALHLSISYVEFLNVTDNISADDEFQHRINMITSITVDC